MSEERDAPLDVADVAGFALRAPQRRPKLAVTVFLTTIAVSILAAIAAPRTYEADVKILAQRNLVMAALGNPRRTIPNDADAPTRGVSEAILDQENLAGLVKDAHLLERWTTTRPVVLRWKDRLFTRLFGPMTDDDRRRALSEIVARQLKVTTEDGSIHIVVQWDDPGLAYDLVSLAESRFLRRRSELETSAIVETIAILEAQASKERTAVAADMSETMRLAVQVAPTTTRDLIVGVAEREPSSLGGEATQQETQLARKLAAKLEDKRREIRNIEEPWQRALADLRAKRDELQSRYAPAHPLVLEQERRIDDANVVPPELVALRAEEKALFAQADALPEAALRAARGVGTPDSAISPLSPPAFYEPGVRDEPPELVAAREQLQTSTQKYEDLVDRIDAARIELETTRAAFKYRFRITQAPELPKTPIKLSGPVFLGGGLVLATVLAFFAAIARDIGSGRVLESWQARRHLGVPLLAEISEP